MFAISKFIRIVGPRAFQIAVHVGAVLALVCAVVIVANAPALFPKKAGPQAEVVVLDPVIVTIEADRFDAIRAESQRASMLVRAFGRKPNEV